MSDVPIRFNKRELVIPFFRVGVGAPNLVLLWERFHDFRTGKR